MIPKEEALLYQEPLEASTNLSLPTVFWESMMMIMVSLLPYLHQNVNQKPQPKTQLIVITTYTSISMMISKKTTTLRLSTMMMLLLSNKHIFHLIKLIHNMHTEKVFLLLEKDLMLQVFYLKNLWFVDTKRKIVKKTIQIQECITWLLSKKLTLITKLNMKLSTQIELTHKIMLKILKNI